MAMTKTFTVSFAMTAGFSTSDVERIAKARSELHKAVALQGLEESGGLADPVEGRSHPTLGSDQIRASFQHRQGHADRYRSGPPGQIVARLQFGGGGAVGL